MNLDIFFIRNAKGVPSLCNLQLHQYSFLYIQTCHDEFSHIEDVHLPFCAHFIYSFLFLMDVDLDIFPSEMFRGCLVCVICNSNSIHYFIFKLCIMVVHTLKMCTSYFVQISFFSLFRQMLNLDIFKQFPLLYIKTLCYDCHTLNMYTLYLCIFDIIFLRV